MRCARDNEPAPPELKLAWQAQRWNALPEPGGLLDQPAGLLNRMATAASVYNAFKTLQQSAGQIVALANNNPQVIQIVRMAERLEESNG